MERRYWRDPLTWACNLGIFVFGIVLAVLGAILPTLFEAVHLNPSQAGSLFLFLNLGSFLMTIAGGPAFDRFGHRLILVACSTLVGLAFIGLSISTGFAGLIVGSFFLGLGGGGLNVGTNALVADLYPSGPAVALNRLGVFFGLGTLFVPLCIGVMVSSVGLKWILLLTALIGLAPIPLLLLFRFPPAKHSAGFPLAAAATLLRNPFILLLGCLLFFQSANEITTGGWLSSFLVNGVGFEPSRASLYLTCFWGCLVLGRFAAGSIIRVIGLPATVQSGAVLASLALGSMLVTASGQLLLILVGCVGFGMAMVFPTVMGQASARFPDLSGTVLGILLGMALVGGMLVPWLVGILVGMVGFGVAIAVPACGFLVVAVLQEAARRTASGRMPRS